MSRQSFLEWCHDIVFYVATKFDQDQGFSCCDRTFLCRDKLAKVKIFYVATENFMSQ